MPAIIPHRHAKAWISVPLSVCGLLLYSVVFAYELPLAPASIHDAYMLGQRNDAATAAFSAPYLKELSAQGAVGPHIAEIELLTPFAQVVEESRQKINGYTEQQASEDYRKRGDTILVRLTLTLPAAYPNQQGGSAAKPTSPQAGDPMRAENFWRNFKFALKQQGKVIPPSSIRNQPIYSASSKDAPSVLDGQTVRLEYSAKNIAADAVEFEVVTPDAKTISAVFDLKKLR